MAFPIGTIHDIFQNTVVASQAGVALQTLPIVPVLMVSFKGASY